MVCTTKLELRLQVVWAYRIPKIFTFNNIEQQLKSGFSYALERSYDLMCIPPLGCKDLDLDKFTFSLQTPFANLGSFQRLFFTPVHLSHTGRYIFFDKFWDAEQESALFRSCPEPPSWKVIGPNEY